MSMDQRDGIEPPGVTMRERKSPAHEGGTVPSDWLSAPRVYHQETANDDVEPPVVLGWAAAGLQHGRWHGGRAPRWARTSPGTAGTRVRIAGARATPAQGLPRRARSITSTA